MSAAAPCRCPCPDPDPTASADPTALCCLLHADGFYHVGHAFLSDRANHIHALLEARGYARYESELFFEWRDYTAADLVSAAAPGRRRRRSLRRSTVPGGAEGVLRGD